jgi:hypothetical protein
MFPAYSYELICQQLLYQDPIYDLRAHHARRRRFGGLKQL